MHWGPFRRLFSRKLITFPRNMRSPLRLIREELQVHIMIDNITHYRIKWTNHLCERTRKRLFKLAFNYKPICKQDMGRPRQYWRDQAHVSCNPQQKDNWSHICMFMKTVIVLEVNESQCGESFIKQFSYLKFYNFL